MRAFVLIGILLLAACNASPSITQEWIEGRWQSTEDGSSSVVEANGSTLWLYVQGAENGADALIIDQYRVVSGADGRCMTLRTNGDQRVMRLRFRETVPALPEMVALTRGRLDPGPDREYRVCRDGEALRLGTMSGDGELEFANYVRAEATGALPLAPPRRSDLENSCGLTCNNRSASFNACFMSCRQAIESLPSFDNPSRPGLHISSAPPSPESISRINFQTDPGTEHSDCDFQAWCPVMVLIPGGSFVMGSPADQGNETERPQRTVTLQPFMAGKFEITFRQWQACVDDGGCTSNPNPRDNAWGRGDQPVINVSWNDAQEYARWLSGKTGQTYRLLSEAEWEYAARGGTTTLTYWGDSEPSCRRDASNGVNFRDCPEERALPVGSFSASSNPWGLYDVHGNVWEWVEDTWHDDYQNAPLDGSAWLNGGEQGVRVLRGASSGGRSQDMYAAARGGEPDTRRSGFIGFRVARNGAQ